MTTLQTLSANYAAIDYRDLGHNQLEQLRDGLKGVTPQEIRSAMDGKEFILLLRKFREAVAANDLFHGANYPKLLNSILSVGEDGLYSNNLRFIFELIQNVDDCDYPSPDDCRLVMHFDFQAGTIILMYNEAGFTPFNVFAITGIAEAAKNLSAAKNEIGEKGIGFKSVFGVASKVLIRSGWFSFELHKDNFTIPIAAYETETFQPGTEMTLFVGGLAEGIYRQIKKQYCTADALFNRNPLLFLNKLTSLKMYYDSFRSMEFRVSRSLQTDAEGIRIERDVEVNVDLHDYENFNEIVVQQQILCSRYTYPVTYSWKACQERFGKADNMYGNGKRMQLQIVLPNKDFLGKVGLHGSLYSFLPTQIKLSVPMACHVPFKLDASREFVDPQKENQWFKESCQFLADLLDAAYSDWSKVVCEKIVYYLPGDGVSLFIGKNEKEACLRNQKVFCGEHFLRLPLFVTSNGAFRKRDDVCSFNPEENVNDPIRVHRLLGIQSALFLPPENTNVAKFGIRLIRNAQKQLFHTALKAPSVTREILDYLDAEAFEYTDKVFPEQDKLILSLQQIEEILKHKLLAEKLQKNAKDCIQRGRRPQIDVSGVDADSIYNLLPSDFSAKEAPDKVGAYLQFCEEKGIGIDAEANQYLPCYSAILLSKRNPLAAFAAFCSSVDQSDLFVVRMKLRDASNQLNQFNDNSFATAEEGLRVLRNSRLATKESLGKNGYRRLIELIQRAGTDRNRFLHELLQNADDCSYPEGSVPTFEMNVGKSVIETRYNEDGFTWENVRAITAIGESTKNDLLNNHADNIGEKGVGFKSVFAVVSEVQIISGKYAFSLSGQTPTIPQFLGKPVKHANGTQMTFKIKQGITMPNLKEGDLLSLCLCLRRLKAITINGIEVVIADNETERIITVNRKQYVFRRYVHKFTANNEALAERESEYRKVAPEQVITAYVPDRRKEGDYPIYVGLPTKHTLKVPMAIDAPFELTTSRESISEDYEKWNCLVRRELYSTICEVMLARRESEKEDILRFLRFLPRRSGSLVVYGNEMSDSPFINAYPFLELIREKEILPTLEESVFVAAKNDRVLRYPEAIVELLRLPSSKGYTEIRRASVIRVTGDKYDAALNAMTCKQADTNRVMPVLIKYAEGQMRIEQFRNAFYDYLLNNDVSAYQEQLRNLNLIPVYGKVPGTTEYVCWEEDSIFVKRGVTVSGDNYSILNEALLPKQACETIFGVNINEMNAEWERSRYNEKLLQTVRGNDVGMIYSFLLREYQQGNLSRNNSLGELLKVKDTLPLKNQLGEITDRELFLCDQPVDYFPVPVIQQITLHAECMGFAQFLKCRNLSAVHYEDFNYHQQLTEDDIECLQDDYFANSEEILRGFYRDNQLPEELLQKSGIEYLTMARGSDSQREYQFPENPVANRWALQQHIQKQTDNPISIVSVKVERSVKKGQKTDGVQFDLSDGDAREGALSIYSSAEEHGKCFCQMCRQLKPRAFIEVNNLQREPKYYFPQMRVALCLECSKYFESLRENVAIRKNYLEEIKRIAIGNRGKIEIHVGPEIITFTATHLAEIQEILKWLPEESIY